MNIEQLRELYETACSVLAAGRKKLEEVNERIQAASDDTTSEQREALTTELDEAATAVDDQIEEASRCKRNLQDAERRQAAFDDHPEAVRRGAPDDIRTAGEPEVYSPQSRNSFVSDAWAHHSVGDPAARERLEKHGREATAKLKRIAEEKGIHFRDVGTGAFAGLTVPQYLIDLFAPLARAGAPTLSAVRKLPLPASGMTLNVSLITTGSAAAVQATENTGVQETDIDDTLLTINVRTYAGQQDVSRQALDRSEDVDVVVFQDLIADYFTKLDDAILNADGTGGTHLGIRSTVGINTSAYVDASPTLPELYSKFADAIQKIASNRFAPATTVVVHPRRWGWATAALDSTTRPLVVPNAQGPFNALAVGDAPEYGAVVGQIQGLPVITDANIKTNLGGGTEDDILVMRMPDLLFWQEGDGSPRQLRFEQSNAPQSVRLAVWGYSAFTAARYPKAVADIAGTGLIAPTF